MLVTPRRSSESLGCLTSLHRVMYAAGHAYTNSMCFCFHQYTILPHFKSVHIDRARFQFVIRCRCLSNTCPTCSFLPHSDTGFHPAEGLNGFEVKLQVLTVPRAVSDQSKG